MSDDSDRFRFLGFLDDGKDGGYPPGTKVVKINSEPDDGLPDGTIGVVVSSVTIDDEELKRIFPDSEYFYFVAWETAPDLPVGILSRKVRAWIGVVEP